MRKFAANLVKMNESTGKPVVAINTRHWIPGQMEGVGRFEMNIAIQLSLQHPEVDFHWIFDRKPNIGIEIPSNVQIHHLSPQARHPFLYQIWYEYAIPRLLRKIKANVFLSPDNINSKNAPCKTITVIHDINFEHYPENLPSVYSKYYRRSTPKFIQKASAIVTVSEYSKDDIAKTYATDPSTISVVPNGLSPLFKPLSNKEIAEQRIALCNGKPYFFVLGSIHPRKNLQRTIEAYLLFRKTTNIEILLVIGGRALWNSGFFSEIQHVDEYKDDIVFTGYIDDAKIARLMGASHALLFLSLFEGFGVPIIEAFASGIPVLASKSSSIPEIASDAALLVNPFETTEISEAMKKIASSSELRQLLIEKGIKRAKDFSWEKSAQKMWEIIESVIKQNSN